MKTLRHLELPPGLSLPPTGIEQIAEMTWLKTLSIHSAVVSLDAMAAVSRMPSLWRLELQDSPLDERLLQPLRASKSLTAVWLPRTGLNDEAISVLAGIPHLDWLILDGNEITDHGIQFLSAATQLKTLWIRETRVTDQGLLALASLEKLTTIAAQKSPVTEAGRDALFLEQRRVELDTKMSPTFTPDKRSQEEASRTLTSFLSALENWTREFSKSTSTSKDEAIAAKERIFKRWCTHRQRVYDSPKLLSIRQTALPAWQILRVNHVKRGRVEVVIKREGLRRLFVLLKEGDEWRVDHSKMWMDGGWSNYQLGLF